MLPPDPEIRDIALLNGVKQFSISWTV